jgi:hypothetical protein
MNKQRFPWATMFLLVLGSSLSVFLVFGHVDEHITGADWKSILGSHVASLETDYNQRLHFQFRHTKIFLAPKIHPSADAAEQEWASYYTYLSGVSHLTVSPLSKEFGEACYWVSGIESTFTKSLLFQRKGVVVWLYYDGSPEDVRALAALIDQHLKSDRSAVPMTGTPVYKYLLGLLGVGRPQFGGLVY